MKLSESLKTFSSFRTQLIAFIVMTLLATGVVITLIDQRLEANTTRVVDEYIQSIPQAIDLTNRSTYEGLFMYNLVNQRGNNSLSVGDGSVISHILIVESDGKIFDSNRREDLGRRLRDVIKETMPNYQPGDLLNDLHTIRQDESRSLNFTMETLREDGSSAKRKVIIVISMNRLRNVKEAGDRARLIAFIALGLLLILVIAVFARRFTKPITELDQAAQRVAAGKLDFTVPVSGPKEVSTLSATFNDMLAGLRSKRELEEELQRSERSAVVGRLASGIAHEIRNPLNFINLSIDHIREKFAPQSDAARAEYVHILTTIKDELARLNRLVSDFLSYGRPAKLKLREVDARALIEEVRDLVAKQSEQQNVRIKINQNGTANTKLRADAEQLKTCFSNIMINAVQAMPDGGSLNVYLGSNGEKIEIEFTDTGVGIQPEVLEQVFEPYYSTKDTGIGLGLPLTKKIIEEHGGRIAVKSEPNNGTTFVVTLPK